MYLAINRNSSNARENLLEIYKGNLFYFTNVPSLLELSKYSIACIEKFSEGVDIEKIHCLFEKDKFVEFVLQVKKIFTNSKESHQLVSEFIKHLGLDVNNCVFHAPRIRVIPPASYLSSGVSYNYKPHRDTWYGAVNSQINAWMPVNLLTECQGMWIAPPYFNTPIMNSSNLYSVKNWMESERWKAASNIDKETRAHPQPIDSITESNKITYLGNPSDVLLFSAAHLHGSNINTTEQIRYSIDFRIIYLPDLNETGALNLDNECPDVLNSLDDFYHADTLKPWIKND